MANEEMIGGLISALSRGESLEKAMMTFYNAGYEKEDIEDSAKIVYSQLGAQAMGIKGSLQDTLNAIALKVGIAPKKNQEVSSQERQYSPQELRISLQNKSPELNTSPSSSKEQAQQNVSAYGDEKSNRYDSHADQLADKLEKVIKELKPVNIPSKIEIINKSIEPMQDKNNKKVSDYKEDSSKPINKGITYVLIFILILLLGLLAAVFFFKDELIKMFNSAGLS